MRSIRAVGLSRHLLASPAGLSAASSSVARAVAAARPAAVSAAALAHSSQPLQVQQQARQIASNAAKAPVTSVSFDQELHQLNKQRSVRPISPHLAIYQPQLTWYGSIANRITGVGLSVALYAYAIAYAAAPMAGLQEFVSSGYLTSLVASFPFWLKIALKTPLAAAASYHTWNGFRHLSWDSGRALSLKGVYQTGYIVLGLTGLSTVGLLML